MDKKINLPTANEEGCYEIRLESIGGLGANLCGKLLGELGASYMGLNASSFSSYGSEKRGSPVKAFIRWCVPDREIRISSPVEKPHILGLFHEALSGKLPVTAGVTEETKIVINSPDSPGRLRERLRLYGGSIYAVDALKIAMESKSRVNMVMLGAVVKAAGFIPLELAYDLVRDTLGRKYPALLERNLEGVKRGFEAAKEEHFTPDGKYEMVHYKEVQSRWGNKNAPEGGVNTRYGSTVSNDLSERDIFLFLSRTDVSTAVCVIPHVLIWYSSLKRESIKAERQW